MLGYENEKSFLWNSVSSSVIFWIISEFKTRSNCKSSYFTLFLQIEQTYYFLNFNFSRLFPYKLILFPHNFAPSYWVYFLRSIFIAKAILWPLWKLPASVNKSLKVENWTHYKISFRDRTLVGKWKFEHLSLAVARRTETRKFSTLSTVTFIHFFFSIRNPDTCKCLIRTFVAQSNVFKNSICLSASE